MVMYSHVPLHMNANSSTFTAYPVPIFISLHIPLGAPYKPVRLILPVTIYGFSYSRFLLDHTHTVYTANAFLHSPPLDPYIQEFVSAFKHILTMDIL